MENYIVSARKYRPSRFDKVIGQGHVTTTLKNAIKSNHLAHSFLFCGPRGVGKTTCARILAKTINCENISTDFEACDQCNSCKSFNESSSFNIHELDAASNNTVDDIRNLIDQVRFPPQSGKYKIYIIDEVHMLSQQAFNAFLKTLEEPPSYAIFIMATTEKHKILPTILSRCQIFDFKRVSIDGIVDHLAAISEKEGVKSDPDALHIIAQKADGSVRDALSMLDRLVSFSENELTYEIVLTNLNVLDYDYFFKVTDALLSEDIATVLLLFNEILNNGFEGDNFMIGLSEHFRNLMVCKDERTLPLLETSENLSKRYAEQARLAPTTFLVNGLKIANECDVNYKMSKNKRLTIELGLMKICYAHTAIKIMESEIPNPVSKKKHEQKPDPPKPKLEKTQKDNPDDALPVPIKEDKAAPDPVENNPTPVNSTDIETVQKTTKLSSLDSIYKSLEDKEREAVSKANVPEKEEDEEDDQKELSQEDLMTAWNKYALMAKEKNRKGLWHLMETFKPIANDRVIEIKVESNIQEELLSNERQQFNAFFKEALKKNGLKFKFIVEKRSGKDQAAKKPYTSKEKLNKMIDQNEHINQLKNRLGLELEF